jgi:tetraacyldisaccharide 4'-kinase
MPSPAREGWSQRLPRIWQHRAAAAWLLWPVSLLYRALVALRRVFYQWGLLRSERPGVPVVVVGNVIAGGAGKTPVTIALARHLRARGVEVGVISRGHGRRTNDCREVLADSAASEVGDEPALIHRATGAPVFVARQRAQAARALLARHPHTRLLLCDDGLQHLALARDLEICVFDERGTGNGFLLPAGPLREPWPRQVDFVLHRRQPTPAGAYDTPRALAEHAVQADGNRCALTEWRGRPVAALAAIAQPEAFFAMLRAQGLQLQETHALPDHDDLAGFAWNTSSSLPLLCTEKDAVKLWPRLPQAWAVPLVVTLDSAFLAEFDARVDARL